MAAAEMLTRALEAILTLRMLPSRLWVTTIITILSNMLHSKRNPHLIFSSLRLLLISLRMPTLINWLARSQLDQSILNLSNKALNLLITRLLSMRSWLSISNRVVNIYKVAVLEERRAEMHLASMVLRHSQNLWWWEVQVALTQRLLIPDLLLALITKIPNSIINRQIRVAYYCRSRHSKFRISSKWRERVAMA
jgi:hypothetical protein